MPFTEEGSAAENNWCAVMVRWVLGVLALGMTQVVCAQELAQQGSGGVPAGLTQKQAFVRGLVEDASVIKRIQASQDAEAQRLLALAGDSFAGALAAIKSGDFTGAEKRFDEALSAIGKARRRVPDTAAVTARQRADYEKLLESVESMEKSYQGYLKRAKLPPGAPGSEMGERESFDVAKRVEAAKSLAKEGRLGDALQALEKIEQMMKSAIGRILGSTTLDYTQKFETQAEEFAYELERNRSLLELIPVAITELKPTEEVQQTIEGLVEQDRASVDLAREYARLQDYRKALINVRAGTAYLQLALTVAGLVMSHGQMQ